MVDRFIECLPLVFSSLVKCGKVGISNDVEYESSGKAIFNARFCMCSIWSKRDCVREKSNTGEAYSKTGRINAQYTIIKYLAGAPYRLGTLRA